jgi:hypothetical protein
VPKVQFHQHALNAGEFSPLLYGRTDIPKYQKALKTGKNIVALVQGGVRRRAGLRLIAEVKTSANATRLLPYVFDRSTAFVIEMGNLYARYYSPSGRVESAGVPVETVLPYTSAQVFDVRYAQSGPGLIAAHQSHAPRRIERKSALNWTASLLLSGRPNKLLPITPYEFIGEAPQTTLTLSPSAAAPTSATAGDVSFREADIGRYIYEPLTGARARISGFTSTTVVSLSTIIDGPFSGTSLASGGWYIQGELDGTVTPSASGPTGAVITLTASVNAWKTGGGHVLGSQTDGTLLAINGGYVYIGAASTATATSAGILSVLSSTTAIPDETAQLLNRAWTAALGYPKACAFHEQRLVAAASPNFPLTLWLSQIGDFNAFWPGNADDDAVGATLAVDDAYSIEHIATVRDLVVLCTGGVVTVTGGASGDAITPSSIKVTPQSPFGAGTPRPIRIGNELVYVQFGDTKLRTIGYNFDLDAYNAPEVSILSEHLLKRGVKEMAYQQLPESVIWLVMKDGTLVSCAFDRDQDVISFTHHDTDGLFESVAVIPNGAVDQVWFVVNRTIGGATQRRVERFDDTYMLDCPLSASYGWSTTDKSAGITVTGLVAAGSGTNEWVRSQTGYSSGKRYFEVVVTTATSIGISKSGAAMGTFLGDDAGEVGWTSTQVFREGTGVSSPGAFIGGDVVGVACDFDAGTVVFYKNGTLIETVTGISAGTWYATAHGSTINVAARFAADAWQYAPSGFLPFQTASWTGFSALNSKTVAVVGDGVYQGTAAVSGGALTSPAPANSIEIGMIFTPTVTTLTPEVAPGITGTQAMATSVNRVWLRVKDSEGSVTVNGQPVTISPKGTPYSGDVDISNLGWSEGDGSVAIVQAEPAPLTLLALIKSLTVNQG